MTIATYNVLRFPLVLILLVCFQISDAKVIIRTIDWGNDIIMEDAELSRNLTADFSGASYDPYMKNLPFWSELVDPVNPFVSGVELFNVVYEEVSSNYPFIDFIDTAINPEFSVSTIKKEAWVDVKFVPFRKNPLTGELERVKSFYLRVNYGSNNTSAQFGARSYADNSVLASGNWHKLEITEGGVYKIDYSFIQNDLGLDPGTVNPNTFGIFGADGGMLPEENADPRVDDLFEFPLQISNSGNPNGFDPQDYVLFFAEGPHTWSYGSSRFTHKQNVYSDKTYVFISTDQGNGKGIQNRSSNSSAATQSISSYDDYYFHELENENLISSGREWFGEKVSPFANTINLPVSIEGLLTTEPVKIRSSVASRSVGSPSTFVVSVNGSTVVSHGMSGQGTQYTDDYAARSTETGQFSPGSIQFSVNYTYTSGSSSATGWLDYFELNFERSLRYNGTPFRFRNTETVGGGEISEFTIANSIGMSIWDITDKVSPVSQQASIVGTSQEFRVATDILREFLVFDPALVSVPTYVGPIANQDLHGIGQPDMIILSPEEFLPAAERLKTFHQSEFSVAVVTTDQVYNEFNSGSQDISAIRDFMKMLYDKAGADQNLLPQYLVFMGDGSFDFKDKIEGNDNYIPTYQTVNSISPISSWTSDDYFGLLDDSEGGSIVNGDKLDIAIGRIVCSNLEEANGIVDKIYSYREQRTFGDWRNLITFVGDDEDRNLHVNSPEKMARFIQNNHPVYNIEKIYFDAFRQQNTSAGDRYPDVTEAILQRIFAGSLIINYTGHGGIGDWAHERVFSTEDIVGLENSDNLPVFVTATCDFSKYDDPENKAAGEYLLTNPNGGAIAMVTTVRLVYAYANDLLNNTFYHKAFEPMPNGEMPTLGEIMVATKNEIPIEGNNRKFTLLGDPALRMAYPMESVTTTEINGSPVSNADTLSALSYVTVRGEVTDDQGNLLSGFNGVVFPTVYDKSDSITTLKNDPDSRYKTFGVQKSILFKGKSSVVNGEFEFSFYVPKDINYRTGLGKISYYAIDTGLSIDAHGYTQCYIGGAADSANIDNEGPTVRVFLNDTLFMAGGITDENPVMLAILEDESGINTTGNGIGHDITLIIDGDESNKVILNNNYEAELDNYRRGTVNYPLFNLSEGEHTLEVKAWDVHNNSGVGTTNFIVAKSACLAIQNLMNYPNPFSESTTFSFEHNRPGEALTVTFRIFSSSGQRVSEVKSEIQSDGYRVDGIKWEISGTDLDNIGKGVYVYSVLVETSDGERAQAFEKLVILR